MTFTIRKRKKWIYTPHCRGFTSSLYHGTDKEYVWCNRSLAEYSFPHNRLVTFKTLREANAFIAKLIRADKHQPDMEYRVFRED